MKARRIWSETVAWDVLCAPATLALLRRFSLEPLVAVRPWELDGLGELARTLAGDGLALRLWPMVADADGRWLNVQSARVFFDFVRLVVDVAREANAPVAELAFDIEPPIAELRALLDGRLVGLAHQRLVAEKERFGATCAELGALVSELRGSGILCSSAVLPPLVGLVDRVLGTPVRGPDWDHVSVLGYTSLASGYAAPLMSRRSARVLLRAICTRVVRLHGERAGVSLGVVGPGALGDEPAFASAAELADDVRIACDAGVTELSLFDLGGVLRRPPCEAWLEAFSPAS